MNIRIASPCALALGFLFACSSSEKNADNDAEGFAGSCDVLASRCHGAGSELAIECHELGHAGDDAECGPRKDECLAECPEEDSSKDGETCEAKLEGDCGSCMKTSCCEALKDCEDDADCTACVNAEDSEACEKTTATHERVDAYLTCKGGACASSCITTKAGSCKGLVDNIVPEACVTCLEKSCCDEVAACHAAEVCWDGCFTNHDEAKCHGDPDGHALYHAMGECVSEHCATECE